jgi:subfamily B ATP-binding cassette protein MsbA
VLKGVSFKAEKGQIIALVGDSGGGKSTVLKLLPRYYTLDSGQILINGTAITEYTADSLRSRMAIVNQSPFLFDETIYQNILMGRPDATDEEVKAAAKAAYAHKFIEGLPQGYETKAGQRGDLLSGGQKQRVAIARAILRGSPILILDEATSALDSEAEKEIQLALSDLMKGRTTFVIAHRLPTIVHADKILFIKDGRVVEEGTHQQLIAANGDYAKLCRIQFGGE